MISLTCLVQILRLNMVDLKLIDGRDNLTFNEIPKIKVTNETVRAIEFCLETFLSKKN